MTSHTFQDAPRMQQSLLAPLERASLGWLARRTPDWIHPDHLTLLGLAAMLLAGGCYVWARWWAPALLLVNACLALNWLGDSLDGTLARARNRLRPRYGFYVDHMVDAIGSVALIGGLGFSGYVTPWLAIGLLLCFLLLSINSYLATYTLGEFHLSFWRFSPTEVRILLAAGNVAALARPVVRVLGERYLFYDVAAVVAITGMLVLLSASVARNTRALYRAERVR